MAQHRGHRHHGGAQAWVHLHQNRRDLHMKHHMRQPMTVSGRTVLSSKMSHPAMFIHLPLWPTHDSTISKDMPMIRSGIKILFLLGLLQKKCLLVTSATTLVSVRNTPLFQIALTAMTEPRTLLRGITLVLSPRRRVVMQTDLLYCASEMWWGLCTIKTTYVLQSSPGLQLSCSRLHNTWRCSCLFSADSHMPHSRHICFVFRLCLLLQFNLLTVFYSSEIHCPIFTLSSTMPSVLHIVRWSIITLRCFFLLIRIHIVTILSLIPVDITSCQGKTYNPFSPQHSELIHHQLAMRLPHHLQPHHRTPRPHPHRHHRFPGQTSWVQLHAMFPGWRWGWHSTHRIVHLHYRNPHCPMGSRNAVCHPCNCCLSECFGRWLYLWLLKHHFGCQIVKKNSMVNMRCFHRDDHSRRCILHLLDLTLDCSNSVFIHPLLVACHSLFEVFIKAGYVSATP